MQGAGIRSARGVDMSDLTGQSILEETVEMNEEQRLVQKRLRVLEHAQKTGNVYKTCRYFGIARSSFYRWKSAGWAAKKVMGSVLYIINVDLAGYPAFDV